MKKKKRKKYVGEVNHKNYIYLSKILIGVLILQAYALANYTMTNSTITKLHSLIPEMSVTFQCYSMFIYSDNAQRMLF